MDDYVTIDMNAFKTMLNNMGGIEMYVPWDIVTVDKNTGKEDLSALRHPPHQRRYRRADPAQSQLRHRRLQAPGCLPHHAGTGGGAQSPAMYEEALKAVNPPTARRAQLEAFLRQAIFDRYDSLCRYELSSGHLLYGYFTTSCEVDEILSCLRCLDAGAPGIICTNCRTFCSSAVRWICTPWPV